MSGTDTPLIGTLADTTEQKRLRREKGSPYFFETIKPVRLAEYVDEGWQVAKKNKKSIRMKREKPHDLVFEERVWTLLSKLGFSVMNADRSFRIRHAKDPQITPKQIDVFAADSETALVVECKSSATRRRRTLQKDIGEIQAIKGGVYAAIRRHFGEGKKAAKTKVAWILATNNAIVGEPDRARMRDSKIIHLDQDDISYYEQLASHLGVVARYQLLGKVFSGQKIPEMDVRVPAVRAKAGPFTYYSFAVEPEVLLKLGFVLHRTASSGEAFDTYQRLIKKNRLKEIRGFLENGGFFPNSVIINIVANKKLRFDQVDSLATSGSSCIGVLHLPKKYRSVFIIDGQHRLYGYGDTTQKHSETIPVVAFEGIPAKDQTDMFVTINHKQKSVPKNLLMTLMSEFNWDSDDAGRALAALKTKLVDLLNDDNASCLYRRVVLREEKSSSERCLTLFYLVKQALDRTSFFGRESGGVLVEHGHLWEKDYKTTLKRSYGFLNLCLGKFATDLDEMWDKGNAEGGFIAMNAGICAVIRLIDDVLAHLVRDGSLIPKGKKPEELYAAVEPYLAPVSAFLAGLNAVEVSRLRSFGGGERCR